MSLKFSKMQGLGNDFVVFDGISQSVNLGTDQIRRMADRRFGIGCDQVLLIESPKSSAVDFYYRIFNADGAEVQQCGNGARCLARFVIDKGLIKKQTIVVETVSGIITLTQDSHHQITVDMGQPRFEPADLPFKADISTDIAQESYILNVNEQQLEFGVVSMGNPHAVTMVDDIFLAPVASVGKALSVHSVFPQGVNAGFMQILDRTHIKLRVHERGVGETLACGTGACAAVAYGRKRGLLDSKVEVDLQGGRLSIEWDGDKAPVLMTGPAEFVFEGEIIL